ncbi:MAG: hypothetical protein A2Y77_02065 [Planctomycetes bacterium RBG_13_62_9]|nr:MAG: hypothetical protein A2Y77_02065 [Planctomycetes bacterium RBG_13_62_9]
MVSFLLSLLSVLDSYAILDGTQADKDSSWLRADLLDRVAPDVAAVQTAAVRNDAGRNCIARTP